MRLDHLVQNWIKQFNQLLQGEADDEDWAERFNEWIHQVAAFRYKGQAEIISNRIHGTEEDPLECNLSVQDS